MSFDKKLPPIRVAVDKQQFNQLVELTNICCSTYKEEDQKVSKEMFDKLMKYTFIHEDEQLEIRLFPSEAEYLITLLLNYLKVIDITNNYYEELIFNRNQYKESKEKESE